MSSKTRTVNTGSAGLPAKNETITPTATDTGEKAAAILKKIEKATQKKKKEKIEIMWSCLNGISSLCGCMTGDGHDGSCHPLPPGVRKMGGGAIVKYSKSKKHWCSPYRVRVQNGKIIGSV